MRTADARIHMWIDQQKRVFESRCLPTGIRCRIRGGISARPAGSTDQTLHQFSLLKKRRKWPQMAHSGDAGLWPRAPGFWGSAAVTQHPCVPSARQGSTERALHFGCREIDSLRALSVGSIDTIRGQVTTARLVGRSFLLVGQKRHFSRNRHVRVCASGRVGQGRPFGRPRSGSP